MRRSCSRTACSISAPITSLAARAGPFSLGIPSSSFRGGTRVQLITPQIAANPIFSSGTSAIRSNTSRVQAFFCRGGRPEPVYAGALVGELAMIDQMPRSASVVALRDSVLRFISREAYEKRVLACPDAKHALLEILASRLRQADEELAASTFLTVKARVARALLELADFVGKPSGPKCIALDEKISHADLAAMAGVARENVSRVLGEWRRRDLVRTGTSPHYVLNDVAALEREINETS
jgi:Crp-like helix-turn-helix protein/cyclic nucleotide-binding protein